MAEANQRGRLPSLSQRSAAPIAQSQFLRDGGKLLRRVERERSRLILPDLKTSVETSLLSRIGDTYRSECITLVSILATNQMCLDRTLTDATEDRGEVVRDDTVTNPLTEETDELKRVIQDPSSESPIEVLFDHGMNLRQ